MQIVVGVMILSVAYFAALLAKFQMISFLLSVVFTFGAFAAVVVFQPELRNALARLGQSRLMRRFSQSERQSVAEERSEEHTSELQSRLHLVCRLLLEKKKRHARSAHHDFPHITS